MEASLRFIWCVHFEPIDFCDWTTTDSISILIQNSPRLDDLNVVNLSVRQGCMLQCPLWNPSLFNIPSHRRSHPDDVSLNRGSSTTLHWLPPADALHHLLLAEGHCSQLQDLQVTPLLKTSNLSNGK